MIRLIHKVQYVATHTYSPRMLFPLVIAFSIAILCYTPLLSTLLRLINIIPMQVDYKITDVERSKLVDVNEKVKMELEYQTQIKAIDWNCDGSLLAFGGKDRSIMVWNPKRTAVHSFENVEV